MVKDAYFFDINYNIKEKIIKYLIENKKPTSIRKLSQATNLDYKNTHNAIFDLSKNKIIEKNKIGNTNQITLNLFPNTLLYGVENKRLKQLLIKNQELKIIKEDIKEIGYPFMIVLIFGSYAKQKNTQNSDVDICIISDNLTKTNKLIENINLLTAKTEIQTFTVEEFTSMINKKNNNVGNEIIKNNIILQGIENYYELISKWTNPE
ncbi:MAG: nucleotidyltransferase domain-containing protein [Candidatus Woesearchaeota archaeon]